MIEQKLQAAAEALPTPEGRFAPIVHTAQRLSHPARKPIRKRAVALILALLLLGGCAAGAVSYTYWVGPVWYDSYADAVRLSGDLDVLVPEELGESPFYDVTTVHTSTQNRFWMLGWIFYRYKTVALEYGTAGTFLNEDGDTVHTVLDHIYLQFGSTENELWRDIFPFTDDGIWCDDELDPETYASETYNGVLLQSGAIVRPWTRLNEVIWVDESLKVCFMLSSSDYTMDELLTFAKEIIDLNR